MPELHPFVADLQARGLLAQSTDVDGLSAWMAGGVRTAYCGFDPTADSLHIGNLVPLLVLRRWQLAGHRPILLVGGATGLIGDPSGRSDERSLNEAETVAAWVARIRAQASQLLDLDGPTGALVVDNLQWTADVRLLDFLRDVGKHFSVNAMVARDSVRSRLDRDGAGISFTEFAYMLLQAHDFAELATRESCLVQLGGSDQWGNIVSGIDLIRRTQGQEAFGLTVPLVTKSDGTKFGKTAGGSIWLDPEKTSPYAFYQFWLNTADDDVERFLGLFTFETQRAIGDVMASLSSDPGGRAPQRLLARSVTELVHGQGAVDASERISAALFGGSVETLREGDLDQLALDGMDSTEVSEGSGLLAAMSSAGLAKSNGAARQLVQGGSVSVNGAKVDDAGMTLNRSEALFDRYFLLRRGKKTWHMLKVVDG